MKLLKRREVITLLGVTAAWPLAARAQERGRLPTIGFLGANSPSVQSRWLAAFVQRLRELGWSEGRNVAIEYRWAETRFERSPSLVAEFVRLKVDVIVTHATANILAAKQATSVIPIVFAAVADPVGMGIVDSLAKPGGNITGLSNQFPDVAGKRVELLREFVPGVRRLAILANVGILNATLEISEVQSAARKLGIEAATNLKSVERRILRLHSQAGGHRRGGQTRRHQGVPARPRGAWIRRGKEPHHRLSLGRRPPRALSGARRRAPEPQGRFDCDAGNAGSSRRQGGHQHHSCGHGGNGRPSAGCSESGPSWQGFNALIVTLDTLVQSNQQLIIELAAKHRLPAIYHSREFIDAGGLMSHGVGNITGFSSILPELAGKHVELIKEMVPTLTRVGLLANMSNQAIQANWKGVQEAAATVGIEAQLLDVRTPFDIVSAFDEACIFPICIAAPPRTCTRFSMVQSPPTFRSSSRPSSNWS
jgi:ABC-type uncharacterized transport system substrate-binding protein